jgi:hypothetical protein
MFQQGTEQAQFLVLVENGLKRQKKYINFSSCGKLTSSNRMPANFLSSFCWHWIADEKETDGVAADGSGPDSLTLRSEAIGNDSLTAANKLA